MFIFLCIVSLNADVLNYKQKAKELQLSESRYWQLLLHMNSGVSEIDDADFFFAPNGNINAEAELNATLDAFFTLEPKDDNSSICKFPARYEWLKKELDAKDFPTAVCKKYLKIYKRINPHSATIVFPSAHINSPASMFGHTFLRINSAYNSKLLSYAVNYAANANAQTENGIIFAIKGLIGGYDGRYSLLPYYEKLKEYRDSEQRDIWEYDLTLSQEETINMFRHIWELNDIESAYFFFTENCSYNMLWLIEIARPTLHLREHFTFQVAPLETVHVAKEEGIISDMSYRASKRTTLLKYEELIGSKNIDLVFDLLSSQYDPQTLLDNPNIDLLKKQYILEASIEDLEYLLGEGKIPKEDYLTLFHKLTTARASLGVGKDINITTPPNPINSHRAARVQLGVGVRDKEIVSYLGARPVYHSLEDSNYGFLRGTQIEFLDMLLSYDKENKVKVEKATLLSIVSLTQRSNFFKKFSWRTKFGWDRESMDEKSRFSTTVGAGYSWGNESAFMYTMLDPFVYVDRNIVGGLGASIGVSVDKYSFMNTNLELSQRIYTNSETQTLIKVAQGFRVSQNLQIMVKYDYRNKIINDNKIRENSFQLYMRYYF